MQAILLIQVVKVKSVLPRLVTLNCGPRKTLQEMAFPSCICAGQKAFMKLYILYFIFYEALYFMKLYNFSFFLITVPQNTNGDDSKACEKTLSVENSPGISSLN